MTQTVLLGDFATINMGQSPQSRYYNHDGDGLPFLQGVRTFGNIYPAIDTWCSKPTKIAEKGEVLFSVRAPVGDLNFAPEKLCIGRGLAGLNSRNNKYLYYLLEANKNKLIGNQTGSVFGSVNASILKNYKIDIADTAEIQDRIADILWTLDEKIELNRKMNETLEQIGQALFRHYFVDDVEAKGWKISTIGKECNIVLGGTPSRAKPEYWDDGTVGWINSGKVNEFRIIEPSETITDDAIKKSAAKIMPTGTTVLAITGATLGQVSRIEKPFAANQSVIGILGNEKVTNEFMYFWINENIKKIIGQQTGGAQQHINRNNIVEYELIMPPIDIVQEFQEKILPIMDSIAIKCFEIQTLITLRDTLLPRLMNGKIEL